MEITIELPQEYFSNDQILTFRKEDSQFAADHFAYHRQSKSDIHEINGK